MLVEFTTDEAREILELIRATTDDLGIVDHDATDDLERLFLLESVAWKLAD